MKKPDRIIFERYLYQLSFEELTSYLEKYDKKNQTKAQDKANKLKQREMQTKLETLSPDIVCPYCKSKEYIKHGSQKGLTRYRCKNCKSTYTLTTETFMDGTNWTWDVWVKLLQMTTTTMSINQMIDVLENDYHLQGISKDAIFLARHKLLYAMSLMPKPVLSGVIQVDETFFRENQKGTRTDLIDPKTGKKRTLINVIPNVIPIRLPHRGYSPSRLGVLGPEYSCTVCAVDENGHAVSIILSMGKVDPKQFIDQFDKYFRGVTYLCSDGSPIYNEYCNLKGIPHYVKPSNYVKTLLSAGYISGVSARYEDDVSKSLYENNRKLAAKLYSEGLLDYIEDARGLSAQDFFKLKKEYGLNLSRVNQFHNYLKLHIISQMTGVSTRHLPEYIGAYTFMYNWRHDHKTTLSSEKDAEILLTELVKNKKAFTLQDLKSKDFFIAPKPTGRYMQLLDKATREMRRVTDNKFFKFDEEDRVISFDTRKYIKDTPAGKLRPIAKEYGIKRYTRMTHWQLYSAIMELPKETIGEIVRKLIAQDKVFNIYADDISYITRRHIPDDEQTYSKGTGMVDLERLFIMAGDEKVLTIPNKEKTTGEKADIQDWDVEDDLPF